MNRCMLCIEINLNIYIWVAEVELIHFNNRTNLNFREAFGSEPEVLEPSKRVGCPETERGGRPRRDYRGAPEAERQSSSVLRRKEGAAPEDARSEASLQ